jgi:hypothetical protein
MSFARGNIPLLAVKLDSACGITEQDTECSGTGILLGFEMQAPSLYLRANLKGI